GVDRKPPALLKSCIAFWLPQLPEVLAFHSAPRHLGGTGATVVLLRKSERARQENFEAFSRRPR
ncbi:MAG: Smr/MutS family protein, partial [Gammaproteobacteria bacterium]